MQVAALVSGGVDSSVVVHCLKEQGIDPVIFYIRIGMEDENGYMGCSAEEDIEITSFIAKKYGLKMEVVSLQQEYWDKVVAYTMDAVRRGLTPNPDVMCNRLIKFGSFIDKYGRDFDQIATGHYATTTWVGDRKFLSTSPDPVKDQTDFLARITYDQLLRVIFPIGHMYKYEVRAIADKAQLPSALRKDSQGICFLGKVNYNDFIERYLGTKDGPIVERETGRVLGRHQGFWFHTIGQRKGLGLSGGPWYVVAKDAAENVVYVSQGYDVEAQYGKVIPLEDMHFISGDPWGAAVEQGVDIAFKIRHTPEFTRGRLVKEGDKFRIFSENKIQGIAPGQYGVLYDPDHRICYGSGVICL
ncbi:MAG: tRNA 2-thiouridine(34) synthase MnmA [Paludibacteraceae bacterium]|nr:tRNA 2-thiouridine(34) synthase MnmA [Paludibacteraceae bacterium]